MIRTFFFRSAAVLAGVVLIAAQASHAAEVRQVEMQEGSRIEISIKTAFERFPNAGYVPARVSIRNLSGSRHRWDFAFRTYAGDQSDLLTSALDYGLEVDAGSSAEQKVLIPVALSPWNRTSYRPATVTVTGADVANPIVSFNSVGPTGRKTTHFFLMSPDLATRAWDLLKVRLDKAHSRDLEGSEVDLSILGDDWRALAGVSAFFISVREYLSLPVGTQRAIRSWAAQGGDLILCGEGDVPDFSAASMGALTPYQLGTVRRLKWDGSTEPDLDQLADITLKTVKDPGERFGQPVPWKFGETVGEAAKNTSFLTLFIVVFAVVVGPLNLFWFARSDRRYRLFWTTPLISVAASLLLGVVIFLQDGLGGSGARMTLHYLVPEEKQVQIMQEQISRTGLLLSRSFSSEEDLFLTPMSPPATMNVPETSRSLAQYARTYSGDWFISRSIQAHFVESIQPSREAVEIFPGANGTPEVKSGIPSTLSVFYYRDAQGGIWKAEKVRTGERQTLERATVNYFSTFKTERTGPVLKDAFHKIMQRPGIFCALAEKPSAIETLSSIRWKDDLTYYAGGVTLVP